MLGLSSLIASAACWSLVASHTVITYPGWRGNNLHTDGFVEGTKQGDEGSVPEGSLGINYNENGTATFPYGQQWMYPCGGIGTTTNRTNWPITGGAIGVQPGWFPGHSKAFFYVNMGFGNEPINMSHVMVPVFEILGPTNDMYRGEWCLPQVPLPANSNMKIGDNATIQVIELAQHGAALYSCVDITFADPKDVAEVNETNCRNSTEPEKLIKFDMVFTASSLESAAWSMQLPSTLITFSAIAAAFFWI